MEDNQYLFQVNLKGMISLLSEHLYSNPNTFVRELLQNGIDAITALKTLDEHHEGALNVHLPEEGQPELVFEDNGIGLKEDEFHRFLAVIGESSKRDAFEAKDYIGKFGIGLLSCFVVSDEIIVESRSAFTEQAFRWTGRADGTYEVSLIAERRSVGTRVRLLPKSEFAHLFKTDVFQKNLLYYGAALPVPVYLQEGGQRIWVNEAGAVWLDTAADKQTLLDVGKKVFNTTFLDAFPISSLEGAVKGVAYILPHKIQFTGRQSHQIYLKRMFLTEEDAGLFPKWAFFIRCILNTDGLDATASRESLVYNQTLKSAKQEISDSIKTYLKNIGLVNPQVYHQLMDTHYLHLKAIAAEDNDLLRVLYQDLPFETNKGIRNFRHIREATDAIYYTPNIDDFKQVQRIAGAQGILIINAAYTFEEQLLKRIQRIDPECKATVVSPASLMQSFHGVDTSGDIKLADLENRASAVLKEFHCECKLKRFNPSDTPAIYILPQDIGTMDKKQQVSANNPLASALGAFAPKKKTEQPQLCLNMDNKLVQSLLSIRDPYVFPAIVQLIYVQSLLLGKYPVTEKEMNLFNEALHSLVIMGMENFINI
ncbi:putative heat-shock protein [Pedobacter sp. BAL39]|uniref:HSP90 family protein n=1 Tax=Pedobacter sp. BAL39 TaxID=391596 RepID=UPI0001559BE5|nr:HSP90 family protein [Pedobacter sp. BAL39]EDM36515.1 putative heat-shock protein [Pedobacter sp. BAL39]